MECVIKSREVDAFSWKHQESSVIVVDLINYQNTDLLACL